MEKSPETQRALAVLEKFTSDQCCGKCISCREGTRQMELILSTSSLPFPSRKELALILELGALIEHTARCGLGKSIARQVLSVLEHQGGEERIIEEYLPGPYQELLFFTIDPNRCRGCSKCARNCPAKAISGVIKQPFTIDHSLCIKCGTCMMNCKFGAISIKD
ncbi:MAG: NADH-ubiquinone oxidoreductase-F iron-sulfur binding region domain-containing protein [Mailhella sp.]